MWIVCGKWIVKLKIKAEKQGFDSELSRKLILKLFFLRIAALDQMRHLLAFSGYVKA